MMLLNGHVEEKVEEREFPLSSRRERRKYE
jgi:hypothetical protein